VGGFDVRRHHAHTVKSVTLLFGFFTLTISLHAEVVVGKSLEWLTDTSSCIGIYLVDSPGKESFSAYKLVLRHHESLKGDPPSSARSDYWIRPSPNANPPTASVEIGDRFLVFFAPDDEGVAHVSHLINLTNQHVAGLESVAINSAFQIVAPKGIVPLVSARLHSHPKTKVVRWQEYPETRVEVPVDAPCHRELYAGSTSYLLVPEDLTPKK